MKKGTIYAICGSVLLIGAVFSGVKLFQSLYTPKSVQSEAVETVEPLPTVEASPTPAPSSAPVAVTEQEVTPAPTPSPTPYISPIDFEELQAVNPDIYGWLEIEGTNISYPIVQDPEDDTFYLNHNSDGAYSANGAIFSESAYNGTDLTDAVTILYGHHMKSGAMFGDLQQDFSDGTFFDEHQIIKIYTPTGLLEYGVFAALPFSSDHILYYNDFSDDSEFDYFFATVLGVRDLSARFREEYEPRAGDRVLMLSTCLAGNNTRRFLVMATLLP